MTKKEFFVKKIIPQIEEQIFTYEYHLIRSQYALDQLQKELVALEQKRPLKPGEEPEKVLRETQIQKGNLKREIEEAKRNIAVLPLLKSGEERFLEYFKKIVEKL
jgi:hypothetical protein